MDADKVVEYMGKFIEAVTPIAKQAYDVGLMTLRVDALATLVPAVILFVMALFVAIKYLAPELRKEWLKQNDFILMGGGMFCLSAGAVSTINLLSIWVWVKLFAPELWLAHQLMEKIVK